DQHRTPTASGPPPVVTAIARIAFSIAEVIISETGYGVPTRDKRVRSAWLAGGQQLVGRPVPAVEVDELGKRTTTKRPVLALGPPDHDVAGDQPVLGHADGRAQRLLATVRSPAGEACSEALGARGQQEVLHGGEDRPAQQQLGCRRIVLLREQDR